MSSREIHDLLQQIERETGVSPILHPPAEDLEELPVSLAPLYAITNGVTLPFGEVYPVSKFRTEGFPADWFCFGNDPYSSFYLCHRYASPAITSWDHESDTEIEAVYDTAKEFLAEEYQGFIESDLRSCTVRVTAIPATVSKSVLLSHLKPLVSRPSSEWLQLLRDGAFEVAQVPRHDAIQAVRALQESGVKCSVDCGLA